MWLCFSLVNFLVCCFVVFFFFWFFFFFQAEDGIRDRDVTGVQTCALPIFHFGDVVFQHLEPPRVIIGFGQQTHAILQIDRAHALQPAPQRNPLRSWLGREIGRASCRERV